jgi:hypothetical protein
VRWPPQSALVCFHPSAALRKHNDGSRARTPFAELGAYRGFLAERNIALGFLGVSDGTRRVRARPITIENPNLVPLRRRPLPQTPHLRLRLLWSDLPPRPLFAKSDGWESSADGHDAESAMCVRGSSDGKEFVRPTFLAAALGASKGYLVRKKHSLKGILTARRVPCSLKHAV